MGLRQALSRWRAADESGERQRRAGDPRLSRHQADPATGELIRTPLPANDPYRYYTPPASEQPRTDGRSPVNGYAPPPVPPAVTHPPGGPPRAHLTGGLVVGPAERRQAPVPMPHFYVSAPKPYDRSEVRRAWDLVSDRAEGLVRNFYAELFLALGGEAQQMFPPDMVMQREDFGRALVQWVVTDDPEAMAGHLSQLGADHRKFDVEPHHYDVAGTALVNAWKGLAGADWTLQMEAAVGASYTRLATTMIDGAMTHRDAPRWWGATVVAHERVLNDFAVLRIQPDGPYPYKAGQYLTIEIASHAKQWRQMSIASAPRPDNTFELHVRSVNATGVSAGLVMHTGVGDRVRLGPPRGNDLVVELGTVTNGLLCVCSGTGAAPISAVVESMMRWPECPPLYAFVGARTAADMYPAERLNRLVRSGGKGGLIQVHGVVSDDVSYTGLRGRVEDVVPPLKDWAQLGVDVLVAGPDSMIATTIIGLTDLGVPIGKVHFDQYDVAV